ncbi:MAG: hypothetical protein DHS80DRAFT_29681 [Piptocephalis tieghemiana]|nr:MAG: hypothetical protein DHS80DRAFT_29681 [Piptocephalis tieghemiana]
MSTWTDLIAVSVFGGTIVGIMTMRIRQHGARLRQLRSAIPWSPMSPRASLVWVEGIAKAHTGSTPFSLTPQASNESKPFLLHHILSTEYGTRWNRFEERTEDFVNMRANNLRSIPFTITSNQDPDRSILVPQLTQKPEGLKMDSISSRIEPLFQAGSVSTVEEGLPEGALVSGCGIAEMGPEGWQLLLPPSSGASNRPWWCRWIPSSSSSFSSITPPLLLMRGGWEEAVDLVEHEFQRSIRWSWCIGLGLGTVLLFFLLSPRHTTHPGDDILGA